MRELIRKRLPDDVLTEVLGEEECEERVKEIIKRSGGYPREVVHMLRRLLELPDFPVTDDDLERAHNEVRERFRAVVTREDFKWLSQVARDQTLTIQNDDHRPAVDRALRNNVVLRYCNTDTWYDLHPAVREIDGIKSLLDREP